MKDEILNMSETILRLCKEKPYVRGCYWKLYYEYLIEEGIAFTSKKGGYFIPFKHLEDMPSPESVSRTYRALRELHPEIMPSVQVQEYRAQNKAEMDDIPNWKSELCGSRPLQTTLFNSGDY